EVRGRARGGRDAEGVAVELALELREHEGDGLGRTRRGRDDVDRRGARTAQVAVGAVLEVLVARVRVDRGHEATLDAEGLVEDLREGREAVRGARGVRHDVLRRGVVVRVVDTHDEGAV